MSTEMHPVESSNISHVGYDPQGKELHVKFKDGNTWAYPNVSHEQYIALSTADSIGSHFHKHIKTTRQGARKLAKET